MNNFDSTRVSIYSNILNFYTSPLYVRRKIERPKNSYATKVKKIKLQIIGSKAKISGYQTLSSWTSGSKAKICNYMTKVEK